MVKLSEIDPEKLEEIRKFIIENWGKYSLISKYGKTMSDVIEERFGIRLSPQQISRIRRNEVSIKITLPLDVAREIEAEFGSLSKGIKELFKGYQGLIDMPDWLRKIHKELLKMGKVKMDEFSKVVEPLLPEGKTAWDVLGELGRLNLLRRVGDYYVIYKIPKSIIPFQT